ncbi:MAG: peptidase, partial [Phototrophicales bacterium]
MKKLMRFLVPLVILMSFVFSASMAQTNGYLRFVHAIPGVSGVDIYLNGNLSVSGLRFGNASGYINVPAGNHTLS